MNNFGKISYGENKTPKGYICSKCGAENVKLWRQYQTFLSHIELMCAKCAGESEGKDISSIDDDGMINSERHHKTDQIGWMIPAVPTEDGDTFWGYTSVPQKGVEWWKNLESLPNIKKLRKKKLQKLEKDENKS